MFLLHHLRSEENNRATWKLNDISEVSEQESQGCIRSKFELKSGPSVPSTTALQFMCDGATLSGVEFELAGPGYRISLAKKRFTTGQSTLRYVATSLPVYAGKMCCLSVWSLRKSKL